MILNFQLNDRYLLTAILLGQPDLRELVARQSPLDQRIALRLNLGPLNGNCSTRVEEGTHGSKRFLDRLKSRQTLTCAGIHDRALGGKQVAAPVGAKPVGDLPNDRAQADRLFAGVMGGGKGGIVPKEAPVVLDLGRAFLPPSAVGGGGLERETAVDTPLPIPPVLIPGCRVWPFRRKFALQAVGGQPLH